MIVGQVDITNGLLENALNLMYPVQVELGSYSW